jgi:Uma2 family endonuclease
MATTTGERRRVADPCLEWFLLDWQRYRTLSRLREGRAMPRMVYLDGTVYLMKPSFPHEVLVSRLSQLVMTIAAEFRIPVTSAGHTTFRRKKKGVAVEGDATYYVANEARIRGKRRIDLRVDPPPDLAIEAMRNRGAGAAVEAFRRLGVPEIWVWRSCAMRILVRQNDGRYAEAAASAGLAFVTAAEICDQVSRLETVPESEWLNDVRQWVRETLAPRRAAGISPTEPKED